MKQFFGSVVKFIVVLVVLAGVVYSAIRYWDSIVCLVAR